MDILCLHKGDRVLLSCGDRRMTKEDTDQLKQQLEGRFPDVEFTFIGGVDIVAHQGASGCRGHRE